MAIVAMSTLKVVMRPKNIVLDGLWEIPTTIMSTYWKNHAWASLYAAKGPQSRYNRDILSQNSIIFLKLKKYILHCKAIPVMETGFSLCSISHREKPVFISWDPCNENRFFPVWKYYTGKTLFWPCTGPVRDCSVRLLKSFRLFDSLENSFHSHNSQNSA